MDKQKKVLVVFGEEMPKGDLSYYDTVIAGEQLKKFIEAGSVQEASAFAEELSRLTLQDGSRLTASFTYRGYELWWIYYNSLFLYFCLPWTQYKKLLEYLKGFKSVYLYQPPYKSLFSYYLEAYGCKTNILLSPGLRSPSFLPFGIFLQILITLLCLPVLMVRRYGIMVFVGDKFAKSQDYDFRMKFIYQELRQRKIPFVEFIRSLESWKPLLQHIFVRKRPVIYSEGVFFIGKFFSIFSKSPNISIPERGPLNKFKFLAAIHYTKSVYDDIWTIRIMRWILRIIGVKAAFITAAAERNFHTFLGCKLSAIPTVGILHGVASPYYTVYDFLPGFTGKQPMSVDRYGVWSDWWKKYYIENSKVYLPEQLYVSGLMRPLQRDLSSSPPFQDKDAIKVLFVAGQLAAPEEAVPYLEALLKARGVTLYTTFRPYRDELEKWLRGHYPEILAKIGEERILRGDIHDAIGQCDVVVGSYSTAVLEALQQFRIPIFFRTKKWGDYFNLKSYDEKQTFFAEDAQELIAKIKNARTVPKENLKRLQERYFGDPYKNGSAWVVGQLQSAISNYKN